MSRYYRITTARETGTKVTTGHADDVGLDRGLSDYDGIEHTLWYNICEVHASCVGHQTLALARSFASVPTQWCEECRDAVWREMPTADEALDALLGEEA